MHAYHYPLDESGTKTGLRVITLCRKDRVLLRLRDTLFYRKLKLCERKKFALSLALFCLEARFEKTAWR